MFAYIVQNSVEPVFNLYTKNFKQTYDIMIGLWQLLYMCKAEKSQLNDKVATGGFCAQRTVADKVQTKGNEIYYTINANKPWNIMQGTYKNKR